ncbi:hypothetical protein PENTCL1PPCAC_20193, partial [Pristionchus entomophagus]
PLLDFFSWILHFSSQSSSIISSFALPWGMFSSLLSFTLKAGTAGFAHVQRGATLSRDFCGRAKGLTHFSH